MTDIKRLTELAGLNEYTPSSELFIKMDRVAGDALSAFRSQNNTDSLEKIVNYYAMTHGVDEEQLLATVSGYLKNPSSLMTKNVGEDHETDETVTFSVNDEEGYNAIMDQFGGHISWDGDYMIASEVVFNAIGELLANMGIDEPNEIGSEMNYEEANRVRELSGITPIQEETEMERAVHELSIAFDEYPDVVADWDYENYEGDPVDNVIDNVAKEQGVDREELTNAFHDRFGKSVYDYAQEILDRSSHDDGQPSEYEEWQDHMGGDDWDHGQYDESGDFGKRYEEYKEQLAFEEFEQAMQEAVTFAGGEPPQTRAAAQADRYTRPGTFDVSKDITDQPTKPHAKTAIGHKEPWEYTGDLGSSLGLKQKIDPENYASVLSRDFHKWMKSSDLKSNKTRTVYDKMNNKQIKSTVWNPKGRHEDITAFEILSGSGGNFAPGIYVRKDAAPPEMIQRGRESGR